MYQASQLLSKKGFEIKKKSYEESKMIFPLFHDNGNIPFSSANNSILSYVLKYLSDNCSFFVKCNMMQCKHIISLNRQFDISKIGLLWHQRKHISLSKYRGNYINPKIIRDNEICCCDMIDFDEDNKNMYV